MESEKSFFGRQETLNLLKRRVLDLKEGYRQNLAFLGTPYAGKSFLLQKFISDLDDKEIIPAYLDLEQKDFRYLFTNFAGSILYHFAKVNDFPLHNDINVLSESIKKYLPQTVRAVSSIQKLISKKRFTEAYSQLISLPEVFTLESGKFCLIVLDEFHLLEDFDLQDVFQELGKRIMTQKRCLYVVSSSAKGEAKKILSEKLFLLFGHFEIVEVNSFDAKTAQQFIAQRLGNIRIGENLKSFLFDFTGGHPFYLDILASRIRNLSLMHRQDVAFLPILSQAVEDTIFNRWGVLSRHFEILINSLSAGKSPKEIYSILVALSNSQHKIEDIVVACDLKKSFIRQKISRLIELGIVEKSGNFYYLQDKLLRYWIKYIFQKRLNNIDCDPKKQKVDFRKEFAAAVEIFQMASQKELSLRIIELLQCFGNESFNCQGRRYRLPSFRKIKPIKLRNANNQSFDIIKASSEDGLWFIILKQDSLSEKDVNLFMDESRKFNQKPQKCVVISLDSLEDNVRLRALQEKMWIWSEGELNLLLNMYDKPYIIQ
ncbi:MAG: hypothetical protein P9M07_01285 [Candidatus Aceula meridiana]|nr:hypothetical protein [Candidatus Aceula meridiana]